MHKNRSFQFIPIAAILLVSLACQFSVNNPISIVRGSGNVTSEERVIGEFARVDLSGIGDLEIEFGDQPALRIEAEDNLLPLIETVVEGDTLRIGFKDNTNPNPTEPIRYYLTAVSLEAIEASGLGSIKAPGILSEQFVVNISGGGDVEFSSLEADTLEVDISGLGSLNIGGGFVAKLSVNISGGGDLKTESMEAQEASVDISGLGTATIRVSDRLQADISGGGSVKYYGNPTVEEQISGLGSVEKLGD